MKKLDTIVGICTLFLLGIITLILLRGDRTFPTVSSFTFVPQLQEATTSQFLLVFNRAMDHESVEKNFRIEPAIIGKFSWIGRKMAFTPEEPLEYGSVYTVTLSGATDKQGKILQPPLQEKIHAPTRQILYLSTTEATFKQLVIYDFQTEKMNVITPEDITVRQFTVHPNGEDVIFFGVRETSENEKQSPTSVQELFQLHIPTKQVQVLSDNTFINTVFDLAPDGSFLALDRVQKNSQEARKIWTKGFHEEQWQPFRRKEFGFDEIRISPYGKYLLGVDLEALGYVLAPHDPQPEDVQFLGNFDRVFDFSPKGQKIIFGENAEGDIFSRFNHFVIFDTSGSITKILEGIGRVTVPQFSPGGEQLYFLMKQARDAEAQILDQTFQIFVYDFASENVTQLTDDENYSVVSLSVSPDNRKVLFERSAVTSTEDFFDPDMRIFEHAMAQPLQVTELWVKDIATGAEEKIEIKGNNPQWIP